MPYLVPIAAEVQALELRGCTTDELDAAQAVYVDLYCPYRRWLNSYNQALAEEESNGNLAELLQVRESQVHAHMSDTPSFK